MSNDLVSQPLSISPSNMGQMEQIANNLETPIPVMKMGLMGFIPDNPASQQLSASKLSMEFVGSMSKEFELQKLSMLEANYNQADSRAKTMVPMQYGLPPKQPQMISVINNHGIQQPSALTKRKAPMETTSSLSPRSSSLPNKRPIQMMEHRAWLQGPAGNKRSVSNPSVQQLPGSKNLPPQNKKTQIESSSPRTAPQKSVFPKSQNANSSSKVGGESSGSVRSKMRESLASALALVIKEASKPSSSGKKDEASVQQRQSMRNQPDSSFAASQDGGYSVNEESKETLPGVGELDGQPGSSVAGVDVSTAVVPMPSGQQDFQSDIILSTDDVPFSDHFFVKDELLQGNGLTWVLESDMGMFEGLSGQNAAGNNLMQEEVSKEAVKSPEDLAAQIEAELFKLFGGVNKKYREKGRSLLFNLKDRNNPELRERVVSGEISPERLCSMTAEELASKELSEWRMAKAEEFASMVVLPDSSADVRRLVKKTHKGEFEVVEIEQDDGISEEVSLGARSTLRSRPRSDQNNSSKAKTSNLTKEVSGGKGNSSVAGLDGQFAFTIPPEDQVSEVDIVVEDALGNLPPIVSLDEFMESLDTEPPFEDLQAQDRKTTGSPEKDGSEKNSRKSPKAAGDVKLEKPDKTEDKKTLVEVKSNDSLGKSKSKNSPVVSKGEQVWHGSLQLNTSSTASVVGIFKSGEKTTTKDWSSSVEIKGRVRLDAFEKFLQDLRMSRSRAIMVVHFLRDDGASETECASITEVGESYVTDERVGFAEPCKGVELYFCPPHTRTVEMLSKILPEDQIQQALDSVDCGLIGVVIWRRNQFAENNSSHKHNHPKKLHISSSGASKSRHDKSVNVMSSSSRFSRPQQPVSNVDDNDDDDVPPGFGPTSVRDVDDLPEFNFSGNRSGVQAPTPLPTRSSARPVEKIRELILKYGQTEGSSGVPVPVPVPLQPWNDDDDDIPEWQPQQVATPRADLGDNNPMHPLVGRATHQHQHVVSPPPPGWPAQGVVPYSGGVQGRQTYHQPRDRGY